MEKFSGITAAGLFFVTLLIPFLRKKGVKIPFRAHPFFAFLTLISFLVHLWLILSR